MEKRKKGFTRTVYTVIYTYTMKSTKKKELYIRASAPEDTAHK